MESRMAAPSSAIPMLQPLGLPTSQEVESTASPPLPANSGAELPKSGESSEESRGLRKIPRSMMTSWKLRYIQQEQGGICPISLREFKREDAKDWCIDHDHLTGEIRGVLYRSANAVEGKVKNSVARWGGTGEDYSKIIPYLKRIIAYLEQPGTGYMYALHKTDDEKRDDRNRKAREARAAAKAKLALRSRKEPT